MLGGFLNVHVKILVARALLAGFLQVQDKKSGCQGVAMWLLCGLLKVQVKKWLTGCCYVVAWWFLKCPSQKIGCQGVASWFLTGPRRKSGCQGVAMWLLGGLLQLQVKKWLPGCCYVIVRCFFTGPSQKMVARALLCGC